MIHIYYGTGKGKTTAALGQALRMKGAGKSVQVIQFLKDGNSSEIALLKQLEITINYQKMPTTFVDLNNPQMVKEVSVLEEYLFDQIDSTKDCIVLDEILDVMTLSLINEGKVYDVINSLKETCEIILTGRAPSLKFKQLASYITEMKKHKHPYDHGIKARIGVEY